ncbi:MAG: glycosyltransferase [Candidatus Latescibacteria bacterium]|nr:glycosyltransferase [Candidatus Latescibacterota bacterium]
MNRICHLVFEHSPMDGRVFYKEAVSLANAGFDVTILAPSLDRKSLGRKGEMPLESDGTFKKSGVQFEFYHYDKRLPRQFGIRDFVTKRRILHKLIEIDADVYHFHEDGISMEVCLELKKVRPSKRVVFDFHEFFLIRKIDRLPKKRKEFLKYVELEKAIIGISDLIVTVSDFLRVYFEGLNARKVVKIMNCQSKSIFSSPGKSRRNKPFFICHEGKMLFDRGLELIVEIMRNIADPDIRCLIIGSLPRREWEYFSRKTRDYRIEDRFVITGWVDYPELAHYLSQAHLGLYFAMTANGRLGIANKFFNYLCSGLPIISLSNPATDGILSRYRCGYCFKEPDAKVIANKIVELEKNRDLYETLSENSRAAFENEFNWERMETVLVGAYQELFGDKEK